MAQPTSTALPVHDLDRVAEGFRGRFGCYIEDTGTGEVYRWCAHERFPAASVCKIPVMVELYRQVEAGTLSLQQRRRLQPGISTHGSGTLQLTREQPELSLGDYCRLMMGLSDNMATDMVIDAVGLSSINATMDQLGYPNLRTSMSMGRWHYAMVHMEDLPCTPANDAALITAARAGVDRGSVPFSDSPQNNVAAPAELGGLLRALLRGNVVSAAASAAMLSMLELASNRTMIPRYLAPAVRVAHKYGSSGRIKGDAGIVFLPSGPVVMAAFALAAADDADGAAAIAEMARVAVRALSPESVIDP